ATIDAVMALSSGEPARVRVLAEDLRDGRTSAGQLASRKDGYDRYLASSGTVTAERIADGAVDRPFVDRQGALQLLRSSVQGTTESRTGFGITLIGESGVGKSQLVERA